MSLIDELDYYQKVDLPIFEQEFSDWLPERIFDFHTHVWLASHLLRPISDERIGLIFEAESVSCEELREAYRVLFPRKDIKWLALPMPLSVIDRAANNRYISESIDNERSFGLYTPALDETSDSLLQHVRKGRYLGFKPYLSYVTWKDTEDIRITDFVKPAQLQVADAHHLLIMLHVPRSGRLADRDNIEDLRSMARAYPNAIIVLAHAGRAYSADIMRAGLQGLKDIHNLYYDLSNVQDQGVVQVLLESVSVSRILYGTDIPVATVRGLMMMLNGQRICITRKHFPWSISSQEPAYLRCTFMAYEGLRAIKGGMSSLKLGSKEVEAIFYRNACDLVSIASSAIA